MFETIRENLGSLVLGAATLTAITLASIDQDSFIPVSSDNNVEVSQRSSYLRFRDSNSVSAPILLGTYEGEFSRAVMPSHWRLMGSRRIQEGDLGYEVWEQAFNQAFSDYQTNQ